MKKLLGIMVALLLSVGVLSGCGDGLPKYEATFSNFEELQWTHVGVEMEFNFDNDEKEIKDTILKIAEKEAKKAFKEYPNSEEIKVYFTHIKEDEDWEEIMKDVYDEGGEVLDEEAQEELWKRFLADIRYNVVDGELQEDFDRRNFDSEDFEWLKNNPKYNENAEW